MSQTLKKVWNVITTVAVVLVVVLAVLLVGVRIIGLQAFTVLSGSMEPEYMTGSLIYVDDVDYTQLKPGDDITYLLDEDTIVTHRIVEVVPDDTEADTIRFRTKGIANEFEDGTLVHYKNIIGSPVFSIPYLGYLANYIQHPPGTYVAICVGAILIMLVFLPEVFAKDDKKGKQEDEDAEQSAPEQGDTDSSEPEES